MALPGRAEIVVAATSLGARGAATTTVVKGHLDLVVQLGETAIEGPAAFTRAAIGSAGSIPSSAGQGV